MFCAGLLSARLAGNSGRQAGYYVQRPTIISYFKSPMKGVYLWERSLFATFFFFSFSFVLFLTFGCAIDSRATVFLRVLFSPSLVPLS